MKSVREILEEIAPYSAEVLDPFVFKQELTLKDKIQVAVMSVTLFPVKLLLAITLLSFAWIITVFTRANMPLEEKTNEKPLSGWRRRYSKPLAIIMCRLAFVMMGFNWIPIKGKRASAKEAPIILLVPHTSFIDTIPISVLKYPSIVAKEGTKEAPIFSTLIEFIQPVYVKRDNAISRQQTIEEIKRRCDSGDDWEQIVICPEGTCGNRQALLDFKLGAFYPGVSVQPVFFRYPNKLDTITWTWNGPGAFKQVWLTLCQFHIFCELEFLPVYHPSQSEKENPHLFAENVRKMVSKHTGTPISYFSSEDFKYLQLAAQKKLPRTVGLVKLMKLRRKLGYETMCVDDEVRNFINKPRLQEPLGVVCDFARYLGSPVTEAVKGFFNFMDQEQTGKIDLRTYNAGLCLLNSKLTERERLENAFKVFDSDGLVTCSQFAAIVFLWKGIPNTVSTDIFNTLKWECSEKQHITFGKFESFLVKNPQYKESVTRGLNRQKELTYFSDMLKKDD